MSLAASHRRSAAAAGGLAAAPRLSPSDKAHYETLVYLLRVHPSWLAQIVRVAFLHAGGVGVCDGAFDAEW